ncbi:hypothetical protein LCGC14_0630420, partial [marine sediment metagenome]|nr:hypothetical protein [Pricia sp.]
MIEKIAKYNLIDIQPLNTPDLTQSLIREQELNIDVNAVANTMKIIRTANKRQADLQTDAELQTDGDNTEFDLEAEVKSHPDSLFVKCFAIKADEMNDNGDWFGYVELKKATSTFIGVPVFTNHNNTDVEQSRGKVIHSWWDEDKNGIMIIARVDAEAYPKLARGITEEIVAGTSMGAQVQYSICSICHNKAATPDEFCACIRERKTRKISKKNQKCIYNKNGGDESCPLCGSTKGDVKSFNVEDKVSFEYNYGIKFIENSFVVSPACHDCGVTEIIDTQAFLAKVADIQARLPGLLKAAANADVMCSDKGCMKYAGQQELDSLNQALDLVTSVSQSMLKQKDQLDLEFVSDLVSVLSDLQTVADELTQQGYGRLQSPGEEGEVPPAPTSVGKPDGEQMVPTAPAPTTGGGSN